MADIGSRSVAEKLAAAKRKHKAYLKEKGLKNNTNKNIEPLSDDTVQLKKNITQLELSTEPIIDTSIHSENNNTKAQTDILDSNVYEADLPLPQYSADYNNQNSSTLPDPLSFFDNFSNVVNVGATFQNLAQPLASFFNNSNNSQTDTVEPPSQVLTENNLCGVSSDSDKIGNISHNVGNNQEVFSYERFKTDAINTIATDYYKDAEVKNNFVNENQIFDQFTNSSVTDVQSQRPLINPIGSLQNYFEAGMHNIGLENNSPKNDEESQVFENIQNKIPEIFEVKPEVQAYTHTENFEYTQNENVNDTFQNQSSNLERLKKISNEMEELIQLDQSLQHSSISEPNVKLKGQAEELQSILDQQNSKCLQLSAQLQDSEMKYSKLWTDYRKLEIQKEESETALRLQTDIEVQNELSKLREDLQCHLQTIGMLVADKTELSTLLNETQSALKNESSQSIDLQNKIKEMGIFYSDLENELKTLKSEKLNLNSSQKEQGDILNRMCEDYNGIKIKYEELTQDLLESRESLKTTTESNLNLQRQVQELNGQLSMANIKIQQLTLDEASQQENQVEKLMQEKFAYEKQILYLNETLKTISKEREESSLQYQQYAEQLNVQISNLAAKLEQYQRDNEQLKTQEENRVKHIGDLERQLQNKHSDSTSFNLQRNNSFLKKELETTSELAKNLQTEKDELDTSLTKVLVDKELLEKELEGCKFSIGQLESSVEQLRGSQPDNAVLLATMESDKVAASRAISQNNELKKQMEGMQEVLFKVNNDNVQLTENLSRERSTNKDLLEKLQKTEISLQTLADAIEIKDKELVNLRDKLEGTNKQFMYQEQLSDRLRHYEAQDHSFVSLQKELQDSKQMIAHLTNELNILKKNQLNQTTQMNQTNSIDLTNQNTQTNYVHADTIDGSEKTTVSNELSAQLNDLQIRNKELESLLQGLHRSEPRTTDTNGNESLDKETAMKHLEKKFLKTMEDIAMLTEEKQRLEHLVLQLQGETETIGEYVTLYQQQRSILKQKALEKDQQLRQLTNDRENIKANLDRLNNLVNKLIVEKGAITRELLEQHEHFSKERDDLCEEHQKIHQEINKITSDGLRNSGVSDNSNTEIAEEIISLLSEIKTSNLVQPSESIHHCPWCSGKLITV